jgi:hypothetical protein
MTTSRSLLAISWTDFYICSIILKVLEHMVVSGPFSLSLYQSYGGKNKPEEITYIYMPRPCSAHPGNIDILVSFVPVYPAVVFSCCKQGGQPHGKQMHINAQLSPPCVHQMVPTKI